MIKRKNKYIFHKALDKSNFKSRKMTTKEAILRSLDELNSLSNHNEVCSHIIKNNYYDFSNTKNPTSTVSAVLGGFIRDEDTRVKRISTGAGNYAYYLTKNENHAEINKEISVHGIDNIKIAKSNSYHERDLHKLLSSYLKNANIYAKTIFHEQSNTKDAHQKWIHPDMVGVNFLTLLSGTTHNLLNTVSKSDLFKINSYEIKKAINSDYDLKHSYFQAVSNSSWSNYGYLVALDISSNLYDEMDRLNQSFGIGIIQLKSNPYESKILYPARYRSLDYKTIDKLCNVNDSFKRFIEQTSNILTADTKLHNAIKLELHNFCDDYFLSDTDFINYCQEKNIPTI